MRRTWLESWRDDRGISGIGDEKKSEGYRYGGLGETNLRRVMHMSDTCAFSGSHINIILRLMNDEWSTWHLLLDNSELGSTLSLPFTFPFFKKINKGRLSIY